MLIFRYHLVSKRSKCNTSMEKVLHRRFQVQRRDHHYIHVRYAGGAELSSSSSSSIEKYVGEEIQEDISMETLIWRAIKLPIYSVALVPLTVSISTIYTFRLIVKFSIGSCHRTRMTLLII